MEVVPFECAGFRGEAHGRWRPKDVGAALPALLDPGQALETIHWGRNYLYRALLDTEAGPCEVVVKQFRNKGWRRRTERWLRGSKAERSWRMALAFAGAGIPTADPLLWVESTAPDGPSYFISRYLPGTLEARYVFRARNDGTLAKAYPTLDYPLFLDLLGQAIARLHARGLFHRDLSIGNVLLPASRELRSVDDLAIVDLNRGRQLRRVGLLARCRDLCRLTVHEPEDRARLLTAYWGRTPSALERALYALCHFGFRAKIDVKRIVRAPFAGIGQWLTPRRAHVHIPDAPKDAAKRDLSVWDHLSDQPHQHASRLDKLKVRLADAPDHLAQTARFLAAAPRVWRRYGELRRELYRRPVPWGGVGVCVRPYPPAPDAVAAAVAELGTRDVLLRLHPWQETHDDELALARELAATGHQLTFALPQNRDLVRDPALWRRRIEQLAGLFRPYGHTFVVGQAINRSKWGIWRYAEYRRLLAEASAVLRQDPEIQILGPGVIDFELHATAAVVNDPRAARLDGLASLLYVDRRGAPERTQLGFDTVGKVLLAQAIADTARRCGSPSWVTEVNWPLWEGPHSPAGRSVSVDEESQADYLARYYLLALTTGACAKVFWWQLVARGYGLMVADGGDPAILRRRPAFHALATLARELRGRTFLGLLPAPAGSYLLHFGSAEHGLSSGQDQHGQSSGEDQHGLSSGQDQQISSTTLEAGDLVAGWALEEAVAELPGGLVPRSLAERDGAEKNSEKDAAQRLSLSPSVRYFRI